MARGWPHPAWFAPWPREPPLSPARSVYNVIGTWTSSSIPFGVTLTAAVLLLRFRWPRPRFARIARQPGAAACAAAVFAMAATMAPEALAYTLAYLTRPSSPVRLPSPPFMWYDNSDWHGTFVADPPQHRRQEVPPARLGERRHRGGRGLGRPVGRPGWHPEPSWIDRAGRLLGVYWIALALAIGVLMELWEFLI